ncbi:hypothetical protein B1987_12925 [Mycobacterium kansasii]|uniref:Uncharacterized protein n=1 Tax=Mycobacterium attenuatum TaxID=2341086 RepID=A0A498QGC9_9MYCO|nr:S-4TM family putative pore-forming effector [Mycobacterium attenuatum]ORB84545.1 hypothetical protein B1987_12925 [Mycobacterium kansasii]VBA43652.1 hypothetical protein LAUMK136_05210 [Mycobacterium attenuatum]VBA59802.1 hypothetical protein LAUMK191_05185 [Mycobacterium attenuatum]VBA61966.1 hypothetical protein LAUMK41_05351 [Mycobacterium attenuatum]
MTSAEHVQHRQTEPYAQKFLQASLYCDRRSSHWDIAAVLAAILAPIIQGVFTDSWLKTALQYILVVAVGLLLRKRTAWRERGRKLRNEFEYYVYDIHKPYPTSVDDDDVTRWQQDFIESQRGRSDNRRQDTRTWFFQNQAPPDDRLNQIRAAQLESLEFGRLTRLLWAGSVGLVCLAVAVGYLAVERGEVFRSSTITLGTVAVVAVVTQIGRVSISSFTHARERTEINREIQAYLPPDNPPSDSWTESLAIFQERIHAVRKGRVIVPDAIYQIVRWWDRRKKRRRPT